LPFADWTPDSSTGLLSAELFGFLGTVLVGKRFQTEYPMRGWRKRILQGGGCVTRRSAPTVPPCDTSFSAGSLPQWA
jgi:hypothetical protein